MAVETRVSMEDLRARTPTRRSAFNAASDAGLCHRQRGRNSTRLPASIFLPGLMHQRLPKGATVAVNSLHIHSQPAGNRNLLRYTVRWQQTPSQEQVPSTPSSPLTQRDSLSSCQRPLDVRSDKEVIKCYCEPSRHGRQIERRGSRKSDSIPRTMHCDGPCGARREINDLQRMGRCDHVICNHCLANAPAINEPDGTIGCANKQCFAFHVASMFPHPDMRARVYRTLLDDYEFHEEVSQRESVQCAQSSASKSNSVTNSLRGSAVMEMVPVHVAVFQPASHGGIYRSHLNYEFRLDRPLVDSLRSFLKSKGMDLDQAELYVKARTHTDGDGGKLRSLKAVDLTKHARTPASRFPTGLNGIRRFVVDFTSSIPEHKKEPFDQ